MPKESKAVGAIKIIKAEEKKHYQKQLFCKDHNMELQRQWHYTIAEEMRRLSAKLENHFGTGYVSFNFDD